jgi:predicted Zn-dependent peptidase
MIGFAAPSVHDQDFFAMKIINAHLGNGSSCRLFQVLREQHGLVYDVSTNCPTRFDSSHLLIHCRTEPNLQPKVQDLILKERDNLCQLLLQPEELELAKNKLLGNYALAKQTTAQLAHINGWYHTLQLPPDFDFQFIKQIESTTPQAIQQAARKFMNDWVISIVG